MKSKEDWAMRPVVKGLCRYESLMTGEVGLFDLARMNEALDVLQENERRAYEASKGPQ